nr:MAG TPA: hypothetical protein [Caudoviricetes sp.]
MKIILYGDPRTKKNSARILKSRSGGRFVAPSKAYVDYEIRMLAANQKAAQPHLCPRERAVRVLHEDRPPGRSGEPH